jgi:hypothetical protein
LNDSFAAFGSSAEDLWSQQEQSKRRIRRVILLVLLAVGLMMIAGWAIVTEPVMRVERAATVPGVDPARLEDHVKVISQEYSPRDFEHVENLDRTASYIRDQFAAAGAVIAGQPYQVDGRTYRNVIGSFGPETEERLVVGAHYDAAGPHPAADDNASGVAGLIELARLCGQTQLSMRVDLVAYTLEEPPFFRSQNMGSARHARLLKANGVKVRAMLSLEMIGYFSDEAGTQSFPNPIMRPFYPSRGNFIAVVGNLGGLRLVRQVKKAMSSASELEVYSINAPGLVPGIDFSDQLNYWNAGYPAVMITDTAFYRNKAYHTEHDTPDRLDYRRMAMVVQGVFQAVQQLAI